MIVTVGDASPRQARGHIGDGCVKWEHFQNDVADVADQTGTIRGCIERVEMSLKRGFHMITTVVVSICRRLIGGHVAEASPTVMIIWKPGLTQTFLYGYRQEMQPSMSIFIDFSSQLLNSLFL